MSEAVPETALPEPRGVYAAAKHHPEHLAFSVARETSLPVIALPYHEVYGPRVPRGIHYAGVASIFCSAMQAWI